MTPHNPDCYWVQEGQLLAGEYPGHRDEVPARQKLGDLLEAGIGRSSTSPRPAN